MQSTTSLAYRTLREPLLALQLVLLDRKRHLQQRLLLVLVRDLESSRDGRTGVASCVHDVPPVVVLCFVEKRLDPGLCEAPCTGIEWLFLAPDDVLCIGVRVEVVLELLPWERVKLFDACNGNVLFAPRLALLDERCIHLTCANNDSVDSLMRLNLTSSVRRILDDPLEVGVSGEFFNVGTRNRVAEERLGEEENEWLAELTVHLTTEKVEEIRRLRSVSNLHIAVLVLAIKLVRRWEDAWVLIAQL